MPTGQHVLLDDRVGVAGEVEGDAPDGTGGGGAPPHVVEVGVHGAELVGRRRLELPGDEVVDEVGLLDLADLHLEADLLPHLLDDLDDLGESGVGDGEQLE